MKLWIYAALLAATGTVGAQPAPATPKTSAPAAKEVWEGPLGLKMGISLEELGRAIALKEPKQVALYGSDTAPSPHQAFESYIYTVAAGAGLCRITAVGKTVATNVFGNELRSEYASLKEALGTKYGKPTNDFDFLRQGSIWAEPNDWMTALLKKERSLAVYWNSGPDKQGIRQISLPNDLAVIGLSAAANGPNSGFITVTYSFTNEGACLDEIKKSMNKSL